MKRNQEPDEIHLIASARGLEGANGFCDSKQTKKCNKIARQKIGEPLGFGKVGQNFVRAKDAGRTRLQH